MLNLTLRRRRSRMPWMYAVYHAAPDLLDDIGVDSGVAPVEAVADRDAFGMTYACLTRRMNAGTSSSGAAWLTAASAPSSHADGSSVMASGAAAAGTAMPTP